MFNHPFTVLTGATEPHLADLNLLGCTSQVASGHLNVEVVGGNRILGVVRTLQTDVVRGRLLRPLGVTLHPHLGPEVRGVTAIELDAHPRALGHSLRAVGAVVRVGQVESLVVRGVTQSHLTLQFVPAIVPLILKVAGASLGGITGCRNLEAGPHQHA